MRTVAFLIFPGFQLLDTAGPIAAFEMAAREVEGAYRLIVVAAQPGLVASSSGASLLADSFESVGSIDTLMVTGGQGTRGAVADARTLAFIGETAATARRTGSVCSGAYLLAAAGLLDGLKATTHWGNGDHFARIFPNVTLESDRIYIRQDRIWTSAGSRPGSTWRSP